jgi:thiamine pyrophosphate-dependent acetolactate synthase large subunit-like protein
MHVFGSYGGGNKNMPTVAESLVATLAAAGVKRIYGIVGDSLNGIIDEIRAQP